jgi:hypothetical protein
MSIFATDEEDEAYDPAVRGGFRFCGQCSAVHEPARRDIGRFGKLCPRCGGLRGTNGHGSTPCLARAAAREACMRGLISIREWRANRGASWVVTPSRHAAKILELFGLPCEMIRSNYAGTTPPGLDCWTNAEGLDTLLVLQCAAREHLICVVPVAARLLHQHRDVFDDFRALWRLDASHETLGETLKEISRREVLARRKRLNGLPKNVRPRKPQKRRRRR